MRRIKPQRHRGHGVAQRLLNIKLYKYTMCILLYFYITSGKNIKPRAKDTEYYNAS